MAEFRWRKLKAIAKNLQNGATLAATCAAVKISRTTLWRWRKNDTRVDVFIQRFLDSQVQIVEDALFKRAIGYRYEEETKEREISASDKKIVKVVVKEVVPDVTAQIFFLTNRAPDRWRDRRALVNNTNVIQNTVKNGDGSFAGEDGSFVQELRDRLAKKGIS